MIYTLKQYQLKFHPTKSLRTVQRMVKSGLMPSNHIFIKAHDWCVYIDIVPACLEYHAKKSPEIPDRMLVGVLALKYKIDKDNLFKILGI
jgi:hypothetical protein